MGRFYNTAESTFLDKTIYTPPIELMQKVLQNTDLARQEFDTLNDSLGEKLIANVKDVDKPALQKIINQYRSNIDERANQIASGNMNFGQQKAMLRKDAREITDNWTNGHVAALESNNKLINDSIARDLERIKLENGRITEADKIQVQAYNEKKYASSGGANYKSPSEYNKASYEETAAFFDLKNVIEDNAKGFIEEGYNISKDVTGDGYIKTKNNVSTKIDPQEVERLFNSVLDNNKERLPYYKQQELLGNRTVEESLLKEKEFVKAMTGKYSGETTDKSTSLKGDETYRWKVDMKREDDAKISERLASVSIDASKHYTISNKAREIEQEALNAVFGEKVASEHIDNVDHGIELLEKIKAKNLKLNKKISPALTINLQKLKELRNDTKQQMRTSYKPLEAMYGEEKVKKLRGDISTTLENSGDNFTYKIAPLQLVDEEGVRSTIKQKEEFQDVTPKNMVGKEVFLPNSNKKVKLANVVVQDKTFNPWFYNTENLSDNEATVTLKYLYYDEQKNLKSFTREALMNMNQLGIK